MVLEIEYFLLALLLILMYVKPAFLNHVRKNSIMKILFVLLTIYTTSKFGSTSGILMAFIFIFLLNDSQSIQIYRKKDFEGFSPNIKKQSDDDDNDDDDDVEHYQLKHGEVKTNSCDDCRNNITDLSREFELNTERNLYNYRYVNNHN
tara:strand:- start:2041 stop:2484 length:444 start_codon:yes stop_codon:yes gene_type:complete